MEEEIIDSTNQINDRSISKIKKMFIFMKFGQPDMMRECQLGTPSAKTACPTVKQSALGTRARSKLRPDNQFEENAEFGHIRPFLAYFWPVLAPVSVFKGPNGYILPSSWWNE